MVLSAVPGSPLLFGVPGTISSSGPYLQASLSCKREGPKESRRDSFHWMSQIRMAKALPADALNRERPLENATP